MNSLLISWLILAYKTTGHSIQNDMNPTLKSLYRTWLDILDIRLWHFINRSSLNAPAYCKTLPTCFKNVSVIYAMNLQNKDQRGMTWHRLYCLKLESHWVVKFEFTWQRLYWPMLRSRLELEHWVCRDSRERQQRPSRALSRSLFWSDCQSRPSGMVWVRSSHLSGFLARSSISGQCYSVYKWHKRASKWGGSSRQKYFLISIVTSNGQSKVIRNLRVTLNAR